MILRELIRQSEAMLDEKDKEKKFEVIIVINYWNSYNIDRIAL